MKVNSKTCETCENCVFLKLKDTKKSKLSYGYRKLPRNPRMLAPWSVTVKN